MLKPLMHRHGSAIALAMLVLVLALPGSALASGQPPAGVHIDPGSPAAKEYQIPLGAARGNGQSGGSNSSQLFGAGITHGGSGGNGASANSAATNTAAAPSPAASATTGAAGATTGASSPPPTATPTSSSARHAHRHHHHGPVGAQQSPVQPETRTAAAQPSLSPQRAIGTDSSAGIGITWMLGAAVIVLLLGALGGTVLARRGRRTSPHPS